MKSTKLPKGAYRITRPPCELFIVPFKSPKGNGMWKVVPPRGRSLGIYDTEAEAKAAALLHAQRFFKAPKAYQDQYQAKLNSFNRIQNELLDKDDE